MDNITSFDGPSLDTQITTAYSPLQQTVANYASSSIIDISDPASLQ